MNKIGVETIKGEFSLTNQEIESLVAKIYPRVSSIPGIDKNFIRRCLQGVSSLNDIEVESKIKQLARFL